MRDRRKAFAVLPDKSQVSKPTPYQMALESKKLLEEFGASEEDL